MNSQLYSKINSTKKISFIFMLFGLILFNNDASFAQKKDFIVVLDAGHGGKDPGKIGYKNSKEKEIALKIVLQVGKILEKNNNIKVIYTRKTDVFVDLWERGRIANKADADLFVSIHCNGHSSQASGSETWVLGIHANRQNFEVAKAENAVILLEDNYKKNYKGFDPNSPESIIGLTLMQEEYLDQSIQLASIIQNGLATNLKRKNRGVKQAGFVVLYQTYMPSVLIETGFITNKEESTFLNSKIGQQKYSKVISEDIEKYLQQLTLNTVVTSEIVVNKQSTSKRTKDPVAKKVAKKSIKKGVSKSKVNATKVNEIKGEKVYYKVQIAAGIRKLETKAYNFKGLSSVERFKIGKYYKYYIGQTFDYTKIVELQKFANSKGYSSAFIVTYKNGVITPLKDVLKK